jgi:hypothetical protein
MQFRTRSVIAAKKITLKMEAKLWQRLEGARERLRSLNLEDDLEKRLHDLVERWVAAVERLNGNSPS